MIKDYEIRPLEKKDQEQWHYIWGEYLKFYETELPSKIYSETFSRLLDTDNRHQNCIVAYSGEPLLE